MSYIVDQSGVNTNFFDKNVNLKMDYNYYKENFRVKINKNLHDDIFFELINCDVSLANAMRRIMMSEVPVMAIEKVFINHNTCDFIPDEVIAHRLGLVPVFADPDLFEYSTDPLVADEFSTLVFKCRVDCVSGVPGRKDSKYWKGFCVTSGSMKWVPIGNQAQRFSDKQFRMWKVLPVTRLYLGDYVDFYVHCVKGIGVDHAKFSPVTTCYYRMRPTIELLRPFVGEEARKLKSLFPEGVIEITGEEDRAVVVNEYSDLGGVNIFKDTELREGVRMTRVTSHFLFYVESVGVIYSEEIVRRSLRVLSEKCDSILSFIDGI